MNTYTTWVFYSKQVTTCLHVPIQKVSPGSCGQLIVEVLDSVTDGSTPHKIVPGRAFCTDGRSKRSLNWINDDWMNGWWMDCLFSEWTWSLVAVCRCNTRPQLTQFLKPSYPVGPEGCSPVDWQCHYSVTIVKQLFGCLKALAYHCTARPKNAGMDM